MRKAFLFLMLPLLALAACSKDNNNDEPDDPNQGGLTVEFPPIEIDLADLKTDTILGGVTKYILTGVSDDSWHDIRIVDNTTVEFQDATLINKRIYTEGNVNIVFKGTNTFDIDFPAIVSQRWNYAIEPKHGDNTLTIGGETTSDKIMGLTIGAEENYAGGDIVITGGTFEIPTRTDYLEGYKYLPFICASNGAELGDITIKGGKFTGNINDRPFIGSSSTGKCGNIYIEGGTFKIGFAGPPITNYNEHRVPCFGAESNRDNKSECQGISVTGGTFKYSSIFDWYYIPAPNPYKPKSDNGDYQP